MPPIGPSTSAFTPDRSPPHALPQSAKRCSTCRVHRHDGYDESISMYEQPAFKRARQYISVTGKHIYLTFPFTKDEDFPNVWEEYLLIRRRQLDELYFRN
jgi:hypothetical protein